MKRERERERSGGGGVGGKMRAPSGSGLSASCIIGTLSKDDDNGSENFGKKKKMNLPSFKLNPFYLDPLNISKAGDFSWI